MQRFTANHPDSFGTPTAGCPVCGVQRHIKAGQQHDCPAENQIHGAGRDLVPVKIQVAVYTVPRSVWLRRRLVPYVPGRKDMTFCSPSEKLEMGI